MRFRRGSAFVPDFFDETFRTERPITTENWVGRTSKQQTGVCDVDFGILPTIRSTNDDDDDNGVCRRGER